MSRRTGDLVATAPAVVQALATGRRAAVGITRDLIATPARSPEAPDRAASPA